MTTSRKNPKLLELCAALQYHTPFWERIRGRNPHYIAPTTSALSEMHLDICLEDIAKELGRIELDPIKREETDKFRFSNRKGRVHIFDRKTKQAYTEYDRLGVVNGLPTIFEIKLAGKDGIRKFSGKSVPEKVKPIEDYYQKNTGYVLIVPADIYQRSISFGAFQPFLDWGGILVPFYTTRSGFKTDVQEHIRDCWLKQITQS